MAGMVVHAVIVTIFNEVGELGGKNPACATQQSNV